MSVLSITAPQFTAEVERLEQETLTEEELTSANDVIYGTGSFNETDAMRCRGPAEMYMTLKDFPDEEKEAYLEALARAPPAGANRVRSTIAIGSISTISLPLGCRRTVGQLLGAPSVAIW